MADTRTITVRMSFGEVVLPESEYQQFTITVSADGSDSLHDVKRKIAEAAGGSVSADDLLLSFPTKDIKMGRQFVGDPTVKEKELKLAQFHVLPWLERFPHWHMSARLLPPTPPPFGVAIHRAAALSEKKDPEQAVKDARATGEIPRIDELPTPWGPKPYKQTEADKFIPKYPEAFNPLLDITA